MKTQAVWDKVAVRGRRFDEIRRKHGDDVQAGLDYDLGEYAKQLHHKNKVLEAVSIFRAFIEDVNLCCKQGEVARKRVSMFNSRILPEPKEGAHFQLPDTPKIPRSRPMSPLQHRPQTRTLNHES